MRGLEPSEHQIQCALVEWANNTFVEHHNGGKVRLGSYLIKIPNEGRRSWAQGKKMKKEGMKKGVSDLLLAYPIIRISKYGEREYLSNGLWLEIKKKGKKPTQEQLEFILSMRDVGYRAGWADSVDGGINALKDYLEMK